MDWFMGKGRRKDKDSPTPPTDEQKDYLDDPNTKDRISDADFFKLVALPTSLDLNEWLATHTISFFNHVNLIYGVVSEYCNADSCPVMAAPDNVQYFWTDDKGKKNKNTAAQYIDFVMSQIQRLVNDEAVFPTKFGHPFPPDLECTIKRIHKFLFHVLAHLYHAHYRLLRQLGLHAHLNTLFTHFMVFTSKFDLVQDKEADILLHLFSLLLKNLADPSQNPKLREELEEKAAQQEKRKLQTSGEHADQEEAGQDGVQKESGSCLARQEGLPQMPLTLQGFNQQMWESQDSLMHRHQEHQQEQLNGLDTQTVLPPPPSPPSLSPSEVLDTDPTKPPTDWLGGMRISAT